MLVLWLIVVIGVSGTLTNIIPPKLTGKIVGGSDALIEKHPYQVSLVYDEQYHFCGGTIWKLNYIITAAHCTGDGSVTGVGVRAGSSEMGKGQFSKVKKIINHPKYDGSTFANDIAILILEKPFVLSASVKPMTLCKSSAAENDIGTITGWGLTEENGQVSQILQKADVKIVKKSICNSAYNNALSMSMICASAPGIDSCQGDSGGPMVINNCLSGVVSWGIGCAKPGYPGIYSDVSNLRSWLESAV